MKRLLNPIVFVLIFVVVLYSAYTVYENNKSMIEENDSSSDMNTGNINNSISSNSNNSNDINVNPDVQGDNRSPAKEITLKDADENTVSLSDFRGKVVFLNFWASWCPPCVAEMPELEAASIELDKGDEGVLLTINLTDGVRETLEKANKYISDNNYTMKVLFDTTGKAANDYMIYNIPTTYIIDQNGKVFDYIIGPTTKDDIMDYLDILKGEADSMKNKTNLPQIITPEDAKAKFETDESIILLDVRTEPEHKEQHIPGSLLIPLDVLQAEVINQIPDKSTTIFVYCRSGNRSATAANLLHSLGYTNVYDLGGIIDWPYETQ